MNNKFDCILFDLDGTLLDTANDFLVTINIILKKYNQPQISLEQIRDIISEGTYGLIAATFGIDDTSEKFAIIKQELLTTYFNNICKHTCLFPGMETVIHTLYKNNIPWGIVTNKPEHLTIELLKKVVLPIQAPVVVSGDTLEVAKPHPAPLLHAAATLNVPPENCLYVGDHERDIQAALAANMSACIAKYGYIGPMHNIKEWNAHFIIDKAVEIINFLNI